MLRIGQSSLIHRLPSRISTWKRLLHTSIAVRSGVEEVQIDDIRFKVKQSPADSILIPTRYVNQYGTEVLENEEILSHLRWMSQKYALGQDMFLIGHPGPFRRQLAFTFAEICGLEVEYLCLSKDTTESDLKQRKEIIAEQVLYQDQAPVRAAMHGRLLIIDGLEKAERNVLPTLNNLLENREMALEDGRFLTIRAYEGSSMQAERLVPIHPKFRVIALGTPVPPYPGRSLDPPLRSRFQSRYIDELEVKTLLSMPKIQALQQASPQSLQALFQFYESIRSMKQQANIESLPLGDIPNFSIDSLSHCATLLTKYEGQMTVAEAIARCCPAVNTLQRFTSPRFVNELQQVYKSMTSYRASATIAASSTSSSKQAEDIESLVKRHDDFKTLLPSQLSVLQNMAMDHVCDKHIVIFGDKGSGKSFVAQAFANAFSYETHVFPLYQELTSRDLLQRRCTHNDGSTSWIDSPLIAAARSGDLCVLDGIHRIDAQALSTLSRFLQEKEIDLPNGERLVLSNPPPDSNRSHLHPNFRIVALGELPSNGTDCRDRYFTSDLGFAFHHLSSTVQPNDIAQFVQTYIQVHHSNPNTLPTLTNVGKDICKVYEVLNKLAVDTPALQLSLRHVLRLLKTSTSPFFPVEQGEAVMRQEIVDVLNNMLLIPFTSHSKQFHNAMHQAGLVKSPLPPKKETSKPQEVRITIDEKKETLQIGHVVASQRQPMFAENVPDPVFHMNALHSKILQSLLADYLIDKRAILLMGNQGVGKNKLVDKLLHLLQAEREYIQLHRDSSIQSLTVIPGLKDGQIVYQDSPLVTAAKLGRVLVIDEVDKADTSVVCVLKALVEDGEVLLYDGRRLMMPKNQQASHISDDKIIPIHPDFKLIVLANRPGFPFLGNHFFRECGDVFATHIVPNLDSSSETKLLQAYAGDVSPALIQQLVQAFQSLRKAHEDGSLNYPFSVREAVAVVRHLQHYPQDSVMQAVDNILAFDALTPSTRNLIVKIFQQHHLPVFNDADKKKAHKPAIALQARIPLPSPQQTQSQVRNLSANITKLNVLSSEIKEIQWEKSAPSNHVPYNLSSSRLELFSEEIAHLYIAKNEKGEFPGEIVQMETLSVAANGGVDAMMVLTKNPVELHVYSNMQSQLANLLGQDIPPNMTSFHHHRVELVNRTFCADSYFAPVQPFLFKHPSDGSSDAQVSVAVPALQRLFTINVSNEDGHIRDVKVHSCSNMLHNNTTASSTFSSLKQGLFGSQKSGDGKKKKAYTDKYHMTTLSSGASPAHKQMAVMWDAGNVDHNALLQLIDMNSQQCHSVDIATLLNSSKDKLRIEEVRDCLSGNVQNGFEAMLTLDVYSNGVDIGNGSQRQVLLQFEVDSTVHVKKVVEILPSATAASATISTEVDNKMWIASANERRHFGMVTQQKDDFQTMTWPRQESSTSTAVRSTLATDNRFVYNLLSSLSESSSSYDMQLEAIDRLARDKIDVDLTSNHSTKSSKRSGRNRSFEEMVPVKSMCTVPVSVEHPAVVAIGYAGAGIRFFELEQNSLSRSLANWEKMFGQQSEAAAKRGKIQSQRMNEGGAGGASIPRTGVSMPKYGKDDPNNDPHVGGNTWAGGSGGSDTAGLGGRGGPYRLDKGHKVHQVSDAAKAQVSEEAKSKAREIAKAALAKRLEEIAMGKNEYELYQVFRKRVEGDINQLKVVLDELSRRSKERVWLRHQAHGDLDDSKLVDGLTGERLVFKRRGVPDQSTVSDFSNSQNTKKRLQFVFDVSASMYRFNGEDRRLERMLEAALMIMESMPTAMGTDSNIEYAINGHSGDSPDISFLSFFDKRPSNEKERLEIMHEMAAHAQFTFAGDHTVEATKLAIENIVNPQVAHSFRDRKRQAYREDEGEVIDTTAVVTSSKTTDNTENYVFVVSDANFDRYNIDPHKLAKLMKINPKVKVHFILIASLDDEAKEIVKALPMGHGHLCFESTDLPAVFRKILSEDALDIL